MDSNRDEVIEWIGDRVYDTLAELAEERKFTTGDVMNALFSIIAQSAQNSPQYDPQAFVRETANAARQAVGLHGGLQ
jgi:hypothetical protein